MKKSLLFIVITALVITCIGVLPAFAAEKTETLDFAAHGVAVGKDDFDGNGAEGVDVGNLRCNESGGYTFVTTDWPSSDPGYVYIGKWDMAQIKSITFDYGSAKEGEFAANKIYLATKNVDAAGNVTFEVLAHSYVSEYVKKNYGTYLTVTMSIDNTTYSGDVYFVVQHGFDDDGNSVTANRNQIRVANVTITYDDSISSGDNTDTPVNPPAGGDTGDTGTTNPETGDFGIVALAFVALSSIAVKKKKEI